MVGSLYWLGIQNRSWALGKQNKSFSINAVITWQKSLSFMMFKVHDSQSVGEFEEKPLCISHFQDIFFILQQRIVKH